MAKSVDPTKMRLVSHTDTKPYITLQFISNAVNYMAGGIITDDPVSATWFRNIHFNVRPAAKDEDFAALVVVSESMSNVYNDDYSLWRVEYVIPKK